MRSRSRRALGVLAGAAVLLLAGSCGVPTDGGVHAIDPGEIPSGIVEPAPATEPQPTPQAGEATPRVYFLGTGDMLVSTPRKLGNRQPPQLLAAVLQQLAEGPDPAEREDGLSTALPPELGLKLVELVDGRATIELSGEQVPASANLSTLAVGQIVLSATSVPTVSSVVLTRDGMRIEAPLGDGALSRLPLSESDYQILVAPDD